MSEYSEDVRLAPSCWIQMRKVRRRLTRQDFWPFGISNRRAKAPVPCVLSWRTRSTFLWWQKTRGTRKSCVWPSTQIPTSTLLWTFSLWKVGYLISSDQQLKVAKITACRYIRTLCDFPWRQRVSCASGWDAKDREKTSIYDKLGMRTALLLWWLWGKIIGHNL